MTQYRRGSQCTGTNFNSHEVGLLNERTFGGNNCGCFVKPWDYAVSLSKCTGAEHRHSLACNYEHLCGNRSTASRQMLVILAIVRRNQSRDFDLRHKIITPISYPYPDRKTPAELFTYHTTNVTCLVLRSRNYR